MTPEWSIKRLVLGEGMLHEILDLYVDHVFAVKFETLCLLANVTVNGQQQLHKKE